MFSRATTSVFGPTASLAHRCDSPVGNRLGKLSKFDQALQMDSATTQLFSNRGEDDRPLNGRSFTESASATSQSIHPQGQAVKCAAGCASTPPSGRSESRRHVGKWAALETANGFRRERQFGQEDFYNNVAKLSRTSIPSRNSAC